MAELFNILEHCKDLNTSENNLFWLPDKQGRFSVGSAHRSSHRSSTRLGGWPWKIIWKVKVPLKVCVTWLLAKQAALAQDNLVKRG